MILVTGSTGLVGSHLLYFLLQENAKVRAIHRKSSDINSVKKVFTLYTSDVKSIFEKIEWVEADVTDIPALSEVFENITTVYHCAAIINFDPSKYAYLKKINEEGTANVVNLCLSNNVKKLCYVSSIATLGGSAGNQPINEKTPWNPHEKNNVYSLTKYAAEMQVWRGTQEGLNAVIVNPGVILGTSPHGDGSEKIIKLGRSGLSFYPPGAMGIVDIQDVVTVMIKLMDSEIINQQYVLVSENITFKELLSKLAIAAGNKPPARKLHKGLMYFLTGIDWLSNKLFNTERKLVKTTVNSMFETSNYDASKIKNDLGFQFTPTEETIRRISQEAEY